MPTRKILLLLVSLMCFFAVKGQETLQTVTNAGNTTTKEIVVNSGVNNALFINGTYNKIKTAAGFNYIESYHGTEIVIDMGYNYSDRVFKVSKGASTISGGSPLELFRVQENGNVGIGTTSPSEKLAVNGKILSDGLKIDEHGVRLWSAIPIGGNLLFASGDGGGFIGIGTTSPTEKLAVNGKIRAKEIKVEPNPATWPDYVFETDYQLKTLEETEKFIKKNKHLPEIPTSKQVEMNGIELGEMNRLLLKKVEELTLLLIEQNKKLTAQGEEIKQIKKDIAGNKQ